MLKLKGLENAWILHSQHWKFLQKFWPPRSLTEGHRSKNEEEDHIQKKYAAPSTPVNQFTHDSGRAELGKR